MTDHREPEETGVNAHSNTAVRLVHRFKDRPVAGKKVRGFHTFGQSEIERSRDISGAVRVQFGAFQTLVLRETCCQCLGGS